VQTVAYAHGGTIVSILRSMATIAALHRRRCRRGRWSKDGGSTHTALESLHESFDCCCGALQALQAPGGGAKDGGGLLTHTDTRSKAELRECAHAAAALVQRLATRGGGGSPPQPEQPLPASYVSHAQASTGLRMAMAVTCLFF